MGVSVRLTWFSFFYGIHWLFPLLNGGCSRAGCGGEMFPSSGGRTDPGGGFRPRAGVMVPLCKLLQELGSPFPGTLANAACSCSSLFNALLLSPMRTGHADQESKHSSIFNSLFHPMSCQVSCGCWESCGAGTACAISIPRPASSSSVIVYLLNANHKACGAYPGKKQLRTVIFMEIMKQAISEWISSCLGGNPSAAGGTHPPLPTPRGEEAAIPLPGAQRHRWCPRSTFHSSLPNCNLRSGLCPPAPSPGCQPQPPHTVPQVDPPSRREARLRFTESRLAFERCRAPVLVLFSPWQTYARLLTLLCVFMSTSSSFCTCYYELSLTLQI